MFSLPWITTSVAINLLVQNEENWKQEIQKVICSHYENHVSERRFIRIKKKEKSYEEMAAALKLKLDISDEDLESQFQDFQNCYPEGKITEEEFMEIFSNNTAFSPLSLFRWKKTKCAKVLKVNFQSV